MSYTGVMKYILGIIIVVVLVSGYLVLTKDEISAPTPTLATTPETTSSAPLLNFTKAQYDAAVASDKLVVLYFYANWCPICRAEFPLMQSAFAKLPAGSNVIGFRVNYNDSDTDEDEKALARQFGVAYQHTKVFLKNGQVVLKSPEGWSEDRYLTEIDRHD